MGSVEVAGSIQHVLFSRVNEARLIESPALSSGFSFGLGGLASGFAESLSGLGELWAAPGLAAVVPADGVFCPRFVKGAGDRCFTPFRVTLNGVESGAVRALQERESEAKTAHCLWADWLEEERSRGSRAPLFGAVYFAEIDSFRGSFVKRTPLPEHAPEGGRAISDPVCHADWFGVDPDGGYAGRKALVIGVAIDTASPRLRELGGREQHIFYRHPDAPATDAPFLLHQHALILDNVEEPAPGEPLGEAFARWRETMEVVDVKHVLDDSRFRNVVGIRAAYDDIVLAGVQA